MDMTIKQLADSLGVSKTAIRKRFTAEFRNNYLKTTENGVIIISENGCKLIAETIQTTTNQLPQTEETTIDVLIKQISEKDKQIEALTSALTTSQEQIKQLTESLHDTTKALAAAQSLHAGTIKQQLTEQYASSEQEQQEQKERISIWRRIFRKS